MNEKSRPWWTTFNKDRKFCTSVLACGDYAELSYLSTAETHSVDALTLRKLITMRTVLNSFFDLFEDIKAQCSINDPIKKLDYPLNRFNHPLKQYNHPYKSYQHRTNSILNSNKGIEKFKILRDLIDEYILYSDRIAKKQSSGSMSTLAARVLNGYQPNQNEIKALAASVLSQDETKGQHFR